MSRLRMEHGIGATKHEELSCLAFHPIVLHLDVASFLQ
jgi:hypothetical protein